jgi:tRNA A37 threonylcarbamoyladenosine modification protein TsaB
MNDRVTVVVETSTPEGSVGLWLGGWKENSFVSERSHNCAIFPPLQELLDFLKSDKQARSLFAETGETRCPPQEMLDAMTEIPIDLILVGTGPGSYSGTRVGIAVAQGLAIAHGATLVGLPSILATTSAREKSQCRAIGDARRGDWWWCDVINGKCDDFPQMGSKAQLAEVLSDGVAVFSLDPIAEEEFGREVPQETPSAGRLWQAWQAMSTEQQQHITAQIVQPVYLKPPHITMAKPGHPLQRGR